MTRRNISTDKQTDLLINGLVAKGYTVSGAIKAALKKFCEEKEIEPTEKVSQETDPEVIRLFNEYKEKDNLCPNHPTQTVSKCGCLENGELLKRLMV